MRSLLALCLLALACAAPEPAADGSAVESALRDPAALERGRRLFLGACSGFCHGVQRGGGGDAPDLFDCQWLYGGGDAQVFRTISAGVPGTAMAGFGDQLEDADLWVVVAYLRSQRHCPAL